MLIRPVVLSGGSGSRLWPLSRRQHPKQFLPLASDYSLLQDTVLRCSASGQFAAPVCICNEDHRFLVAEQLREIGVAPHRIILEPEGRNTAPAIAVAALSLVEEDLGALMVVLPSDHVITDEKAFHAAVATAIRGAAAGALMTFGVVPRAPETGYGYIRRGKPFGGAAGVHIVDQFVEKPTRRDAESLISQGGYLWNSGMFVLNARHYLSELERYRPMLVDICRDALQEAKPDQDFLRLSSRFLQAEAESIDKAVMEHTSCAAVVEGDFGWSDVGSWAALWDVQPKDAQENVIAGDVTVHDVQRSYLRSEGPLLAAVGMEDAIVLATRDAVLVASKDHAQAVKAVVEGLLARGREEASLHDIVLRPWGSYQKLTQGARFQVKRIMVKPGRKLSLQKHAHRAEHWVVVHGIARVTNGDKQFLLRENESTYIPIGAKHRLENPGDAPLEIVEVQCGAYLGEDDIVRLEDVYGRV